MDVNTLLGLVSTFAIVVGLVFTGVQLRQLNKQRVREYALQMLHSFQTLEFQNAAKIVFELPEGLSKKEIEERLGDKLTTVLAMLGTFESLGILICRREIDIQLVEDFISGVIILSGKKFKNYLEEVRELTNRQTYYEWFQWMYEQIEKRELKTPPIPAYNEYRDWKE
jgi:hypothetical protein